MPRGSRPPSLPGMDDGQAFCGNHLEGSVRVNHSVRLLGKRIRQFTFDAVASRPLPVGMIRSHSDATDTRGIAGLQEGEPTLRWCSQVTQDAKDSDVSHTV